MDDEKDWKNYLKTDKPGFTTCNISFKVQTNILFNSLHKAYRVNSFVVPFGLTTNRCFAVGAYL